MNKQLIFLALAAVLAAFSLIFSSCKKDDDKSSLPTAGLVAHYPFDGNAKDEKLGSEGNPSNVQWVEDRKGRKVSAVFFNGDNSIIVVPHSGAINFDKSQDYAISCWLKYGDQIDTKAIDNFVLSKWWPAGSYPFALRIINQTNPDTNSRGVVTSGRWDGGCNTKDPFTAVGFERRTNNDRWHHFVVVKQGTIMQSYLNGDLMKTVPDNTICTTQNTSDFCIGMNYPGNTAARYQGAIDDLRIYNRALTEAEIQQLFKE